MVLVESWEGVGLGCHGGVSELRNRPEISYAWFEVSSSCSEFTFKQENGSSLRAETSVECAPVLRHML